MKLNDIEKYKDKLINDKIIKDNEIIDIKHNK